MLLAETNEGFHNLIKLVSAGFTEGFYYKPRIDREHLAKHSAGCSLLKEPAPAGATVRRVSAEGDRLVVELDLADGTPGVVVIDLRDGSVLGRIEFRPEAP